MHPSAGSSELDNCYRLACWQVSVLTLWSLMELRGSWCIITLFWNSFNHTTHRFNEPWNCSNHTLVVILTKYFLQCMYSPLPSEQHFDVQHYLSVCSRFQSGNILWQRLSVRIAYYIILYASICKFMQEWEITEQLQMSVSTTCVCWSVCWNNIT